MEDPEYVKNRNLLIPEAERWADIEIEKLPPSKDKSALRNRLLHRKMNELAKERLSGKNGRPEK